MINRFKPPKNWEELIKLKEFLTDCDYSFLRLSDDQLFYSLYRKFVTRETTLQIINGQIGNRKTSLIRNNFPYTKILQNLTNVKHYCLWSKKGKLSNKEITKIVNNKFPKNTWFYTERKTGFKSVPEIWHCHVFIKE